MEKTQTIGLRMRKTKYIMLSLALWFCIGFMLQSSKICYAASAEVIISSDTTQYKVGDDIYVYINLSSSDKFGDFEANLSYDDSILEYKTGSPYISGGSGYLRISDMDAAEGSTSKKYVMMFHALEPGDVEFTLGERAKVFDYQSGNEMSVSSVAITLTIDPLVTASENSNLKSLKISPSSLEPEFSTDVQEYRTKVSAGVEKLVISALPEDELSSVSIKGNDSLVEGENTISITVKAETGKKTVYTILCEKEAAVETEPEEDEDLSIQDKEQLINNVSVTTDEFGQHLVFNGSIKICEVPADIEVPRGYIKTRMIISGVSIPVYTVENDLENDFLLLYGQYKEEDPCFYQYDRAQKMLLRYLGDGQKSYNFEPTMNGETPNAEKYNSNLKKLAIVIALLAVICVILIVVIIQMYLKNQQALAKRRKRR